MSCIARFQKYIEQTGLMFSCLNNNKNIKNKHIYLINCFINLFTFDQFNAFWIKDNFWTLVSLQINNIKPTLQTNII